MSITSEDIKKLRIKTGAGMMDCKKALDETNNIEKAVEWLRKKGINTAQKKSERSATDGLITIKIEDNTGVILEINSETDFVAKNEYFQEFCENTSTLCIKKKIHNISLGTVYRNLKRLEEIGIIKPIHDDNIIKYDGNTKEHHHLKCTECGKLIDIDIASNFNRSKIVKDYAFEPEDVKFFILGKCKKHKNTKNKKQGVINGTSR